LNNLRHVFVLADDVKLLRGQCKYREEQGRYSRIGQQCKWPKSKYGRS